MLYLSFPGLERASQQLLHTAHYQPWLCNDRRMCIVMLEQWA